MRLPFCSHPVCLPILFRLWAGEGTASPVELAGQMLSLLTKTFPHNDIHLVGDAAYHCKPLLVPATTITTRSRLTPPCTPRRRRAPAAAATPKKGRAPRLAELAPSRPGAP